MTFLPELDERGFKYYFQFTIMNNPRILDTNGPSIDSSVRTFQKLSAQLGDSHRVIWRYDPIVLSSVTPVDFHLETYKSIAERLRGYSTRSVISIVDEYSKIKKRMREITNSGIQLASEPEKHPNFEALIRGIKEIATENGLAVQSCAEEIDLRPFGVPPGKCVDNDYLRQIFGLEVTAKKDKGQRDACGCVQSRDIGMYDSCLFGCAYCYATTSFDTARSNYEAHDPESPSLIGYHDVPPSGDDSAPDQQLKLF